MPILHAPILEQAGFSIGSVTPEPVINYVARLDGVSQYWSTQAVQSSGNQDWSIEVVGTFSPGGFYLTATKESEVGRVIVTSSGALFINQTSAGTSLAALQAMSDGDCHTVKFSKVGSSAVITVDDVNFNFPESIGSQALNFNTVGSKWSGITSVPYFEGIIKSVSVIVGSIEVIKISLTDKSSGAVQQADIGGDFTLINYSSDVWEVDSSAS